MNTPITIDIWSDIACPWCYIGKRRLETALSTFTKAPDAPPVEIIYHSFELAPDTPVDFEGTEVDFLVAHKHMPADRVEAMLTQVTSIASSVGLDYHFDVLAHTNTVKAHQLVHFAKARGLALETVEALFHAYFVEGRHLGQVSTLASLGSKVGLNADEIAAALEADAYLDAVRADQSAATRLGITGVPFHVIDGRYGVSGAQEPQVFLDALSDVVAQRRAIAAADEAGIDADAAPLETEGAIR